MRKVGVIGAGYVGQPLAGFLSGSYDVTAIDVDTEVVDSLNRGEPTIHEPGLEDQVGRGVEEDLLRATDDYAATRNMDYNVICVGTPEKEPWNTEWIEESARTLGENISERSTVMLRSTVPVGTTRRVGKTIDEESGLTAGEDYFLCHSPERMREGRALEDLENQQKTVGGIDEKSGRKGAELFEHLGQQPYVTDQPEATEYFKLKINESLARHIAEQNQLARECDALELDIDEIKDMMGMDTRMECFQDYSPGLVGGYCLPKDPQILLHSLISEGHDSPLIGAEQEINRTQPEWVVEGVDEMTDDDVTILGVTFKGDTDDIRHTKVQPIYDGLEERGHEVRLHDPAADPDDVEEQFGKRPVDLDEALKPETILIGADHSRYKDRSFQERLQGKKVFDARNIIDPEIPEVYRGLGRRRL